MAVFTETRTTTGFTLTGPLTLHNAFPRVESTATLTEDIPAMRGVKLVRLTSGPHAGQWSVRVGNRRIARVNGTSRVTRHAESGDVTRTVETWHRWETCIAAHPSSRNK